MLPKNYNHKETEDAIYSKWEESGFFSPDKCIEEGLTSFDNPHFSIILPPPNVTGILHMGHAARITAEDILVRFHRMRGYRTLWIPGTDHAAIATQSKVESIIYKKEKKSRHDLGREELLKRVGEFASDSHDNIINQVRKLGASLDWDREAYTLDEKRNIAVNRAFTTLYDLGLIYRDNKVINWDPKGQTTVSDDEVVHIESKSMLYTFYYDKNFPIPVATTRPETKLGDTAVAVHPDDKRYQQYIGKEYQVNFVGEPLVIKVVGDKEVNPEFGSGAVGVTPSHSTTDADIATRHQLQSKAVINKYAKIEIESSPYNGLKTKQARELIVEKLKESGLLIKEEEIENNISTAERTGGEIEPLPMLQWFIGVNKEFTFPHDSLSFVKKGEVTTLKKLMTLSVSEGAVKINPDRFEKTYYHWINNLRDWCISRQIWFGHRIPAYYKDCEMMISEENPGADWEQDPDTLDTWFSSGLWSFSTMGWPDDGGSFGKTGKESDFANYHPTSVLETAYDILFFWVARMILMSTSLTGSVPFRDVFVQGIVRDEEGRKMSKSLGNSINPLEMAEQYGTDALRMSLVMGAAPGNDTRLSLPKIKAQKHFANKVWNATRFVVTNLPENEKELSNILNGECLVEVDDEKCNIVLKKHLQEVTEDIKIYRLDIAAEKIYHYFWHTFADVIIEESKKKINEGTDKERLSAQQLLYHQLTEQLKSLHPFMPFITEEIWSLLPKKEDCSNLLMVEGWPCE